MENKIYNDDVERIVNDPERQEIINERHFQRQKRKQDKLLNTHMVYIVFSVLFSTAGFTGLMAQWVAFPSSVACLVYAVFNLGRWIEHGKCWGWY